LSAVARYLIKLNKDVEILCAGNNNLFSLEDSVCAGMLIEELTKKKKSAQVSDSSAAALALYEKFGRDIFEMLKATEHGKKLLENEFESDVEYCSRYNSTKSIPLFDGKTIKLADTRK